MFKICKCVHGYKKTTDKTTLRKHGSNNGSHLPHLAHDPLKKSSVNQLSSCDVFNVSSCAHGKSTVRGENGKELHMSYVRKKSCTDRGTGVFSKKGVWLKG